MANKTKHIISVSLKTHNGVKYLAVENHEVEPNDITQTISWGLAANLRDGDFVALEWRKTGMPTNIFGAPVISSDGNSLTVTDSTGVLGAKGNWEYRLTVELKVDNEFKRYQTGYSANKVPKDPTIINK